MKTSTTDVIYHVTTQFLSQFLNFQRADEVTCEDVPSNCMLMARRERTRLYVTSPVMSIQISKYREMFDRQSNTPKIDVGFSQQRHNNIWTNFFKYIKKKSGFGRNDLIIRPGYDMCKLTERTNHLRLGQNLDRLVMVPKKRCVAALS